MRPFIAAKPLGARAKDACILRVTPKIKWDKVVVLVCIQDCLGKVCKVDLATIWEGMVDLVPVACRTEVAVVWI